MGPRPRPASSAQGVECRAAGTPPPRVPLVPCLPSPPGLALTTPQTGESCGTRLLARQKVAARCFSQRTGSSAYPATPGRRIGAIPLDAAVRFLFSLHPPLPSHPCRSPPNHLTLPSCSWGQAEGQQPGSPGPAAAGTRVEAGGVSAAGMPRSAAAGIPLPDAMERSRGGRGRA